MHPFCNNGWAYYEKVQEIMWSYARETMLFHPAKGPPVSVNGRVDSGAIVEGAGRLVVVVMVEMMFRVMRTISWVPRMVSPSPPSPAQEVSTSSSLTTTSLVIQLAPQNPPGLQQHPSGVIN
jgi:hypothetical protein